MEVILYVALKTMNGYTPIGRYLSQELLDQAIERLKEHRYRYYILDVSGLSDQNIVAIQNV